MKVAMGPPPTPNPNTSNHDSTQTESSNPPSTKVTMGPPPPKFSMSPPAPDSNLIETETKEEETVETLQVRTIADSTSQADITIPYTIPPWSEAPCHPFFLEVLKDGTIIDQFNVSEKGAYMFGRVDLCDFVLDHPTVSRFHAVMQFKQSGEAYIYDLGSTHGTSVNKNQVKKKVYTELHVGDVIRFGHSSRLYVFQGPTELMPPEGNLKKIRSAKMRQEIQDREASLSRAKHEASLADGISWGMAEDAIEEAEEDTEEITWQTFKGQLTERQQKTREKVIKRIEKIANMKKEIDAIRAKDIPQGGLTQGQQTQIARNEQRIAQILEELESLEETLNESIQESIGARTGKVRSKKKGAPVEDEDEAPSDDDEFYDRTRKPATQKPGEQPLVETADSLLDKKDAIMKEMENKQTSINEKKRTVPEIKDGTLDGDPLDAYMTGLSSQLVHDSTTQLQNELSCLQSELDRIIYLLKIADPSGEASKKRENKVKASTCNEAEMACGATKILPIERKKKSSPADEAAEMACGTTKLLPVERKKKSSPAKLADEEAAAKVPEVDKTVTDSNKSAAPVYTVTKPQWLGAVHESEMKEMEQEEDDLEMLPGSDQFVDYKDRKEALGPAGEIEAAAPGLIIRKRKQVEKPREQHDDDETQVSTSSSAEEAETTDAGAVALLVKHKKASDEEEGNETRKKNKKSSRRLLGPEKPEFLNGNPNYDAWVPPKGQTGDGRTSLNDRFGY